MFGNLERFLSLPNHCLVNGSLKKRASVCQIRAFEFYKIMRNVRCKNTA